MTIIFRKYFTIKTFVKNQNGLRILQLLIFHHLKKDLLNSLRKVFLKFHRL